MKKYLTIVCVALVASVTGVHAGGLMTNTNYHISFDRMMARGATSEIDAVYSNPAGLAWTHEGWQLSFNWQMPTQDRDITTTFPLFTDPNNTHKYHGAASAPFVPGLFATYRHQRLSVGFMAGIVGSGGYVKYDEGVPMFTAPLMALFASQSLMPGQYTTDANMKGKQYIYGLQLNATYRLVDCLSASLGLRASYYDGYYRGHIIASSDFGGALPSAVDLLNIRLDCDQTAWGFAPILGLDFRKGSLTIAAKYEFRTKVNTTNKTNTLKADVAIPGKSEEEISALKAQAAPMLSAYQDGARTRYDMPAMLSLAIGYELTDNVRATLEYHFFDDKNAQMPDNRQEYLTRGTHEFLLGAEWDINNMFTVSAGAQRTDYGLSDDYQTHTSFACDSYSIGLGGAVNLNEHLRLNLGYFWTTYSDYTKEVPAGQPGYARTGMAGTDVFHRTNRVFGIGVDYKF